MKMKSRQITLLIAIIYFFIGNTVGYGVYTGYIAAAGFLYYLFIPYTFTYLLSALVGTDQLTFIFIGLAFLFSLILFFPVGMYFAKQADKRIK